MSPFLLIEPFWINLSGFHRSEKIFENGTLFIGIGASHAQPGDGQALFVVNGANGRGSSNGRRSRTSSNGRADSGSGNSNQSQRGSTGSNGLMNGRSRPFFGPNENGYGLLLLPYKLVYSNLFSVFSILLGWMAKVRRRFQNI